MYGRSAAVITRFFVFLLLHQEPVRSRRSMYEICLHNGVHVEIFRVLFAFWFTAYEVLACQMQSEAPPATQLDLAHLRASIDGKRPSSIIQHHPLTVGPRPATSHLAWPIAGFSASAVGQYTGAASLADVLLGMLFCLGASVTFTDGVKLMVGRPRPNYAALRALVEFGGKAMSSFKVRWSRGSADASSFKSRGCARRLPL